MRGNYLMNCLWFEDISPEQAAEQIGLTPDQFFNKVIGNDAFTKEEIAKITVLLGLTAEEVDMIFFD